MALQRLQKEFNELKKSSVYFYSAGPVADDLFHWQASIIGPPNSPYDGGIFLLEMDFTSDYPFKPPQLRFITNIHHLNINSSGRINLDILKEDEWTPAMSISKLLQTIYSLLDEPILDKAVNAEMAIMYEKERPKYNKIARRCTKQYAMDNSSLEPLEGATAEEQN